MICSRRIYKGAAEEVSVPFSTTGWTSLFVEYYTDGSYKVVKQEDELDIDEYTITAEFGEHDLDLLADGVLYYAINYELDGLTYVKSSNTPYVIKTPKAYSAMTPTDYYHEGEVVGKAQGYLSGYTQGYEQGLQECSGGSCNLITGATDIMSDMQIGFVYEVSPNQFIPSGDGFSSVVVTDLGFGQAKYDEGFAAGQATCSGGSCNIQEEKDAQILSGDAGAWRFYPDAGYDGMSSILVADEGYGQGKYNEGYEQGLQACSDLWGGAWCADANWDGQSITLTPADFASTGAGFSAITISDCGYGQSKYDEGYDQGGIDIWEKSQILSVSANGTYWAETPSGIYYNKVVVNVQRYRDINVQLAFDPNDATIYSDVYHYSGSSVRNVVYNNNIVPNEGEVHGWTWGSWNAKATYGFKLLTQAETLFGSGSAEFLLTTQNIPASGDTMRVKLYHLYQYGKSISASTNYVRSTFIENGEPENTYWYKIEWDLTDEVSIRDDYDEGYAEGYQAGLEACQNQ